MIDFAIKNIIFTGVLYFFWKLFLGFKGNWNFSRFYLLAVVLISVPIYFFKIPNFQQIILVNLPVIEVKTSQTFAYKQISVNQIYFLGIFLTANLFIFKVLHTLGFIKKCSKKRKIGKFIICFTHKQSAFSFLKWIFIPENINFSAQKIIIRHEIAHLEQFHSFDNLTLEILKIFLWFNPFIYLIINDLKLIHEFCADQKVIQKISADIYFKTLLNFSYSQNFWFSNSFAKKQLLKRITMEAKKISKFRIFALFVLSLIFVGIYPAIAQKPTSQIKQANDTILPQLKGKEKNLNLYIAKHLHYPEIAIENGWTDTVFAKITIDEKGKVSSIKILKGKYEVLNNEVIRVLSNLPKFKPAQVNGKPVSYDLVMPIVFAMSE